MTSPLLTVENLSVAFPAPGGWVVPVQGISFMIAPGEIVGLVGESGSGKTLTGLSCLRLVPPPGRVTADALVLQGQDLLRAPEPAVRALRGSVVSMIAQDPLTSLHPSLPLGAQMDHALADHGVPREGRRARILQALEDVGLPDPDRQLRRYPHQLSGGMRQRAMIALALLNHPALVIADEPTTALDAMTQAQVLRLLVDLRARRGMSILLISHNIGVVAGLCDRVLVMYSGRLVESGRTADLLSDPQHPYTQALLESVPRLQGPARLRGIPGTPPSPWNRPRGCAFHPRCPYAFGRCVEAPPPLVPPAGSADRLSACWVTGEGHSLREFRGAVREVSTDAGPAEVRGAADPQRPLFRLRGVTRHFAAGPAWRRDTVHALDGVDLSIYPGESVGIVGESGSGKSTLVRLLALLDRPTRGTVVFDGEDVSRLRGRALHRFRKRVQVVFQDPYSSLDPRHTAGDAIREALLTHHVCPPDAVEARIGELLEKVGLPPSYADRYPHELSGGQRQRVCIARALAVRPDVLLADEPVSALDVSIQAQIIELFAELRRRDSLTLVIVAHDLALLRYVCDRVVTLYLGKVVEDAPVRSYLSLPRHPYAFSLLRSVPDPGRVGVLPPVLVDSDPPSPIRLPSGCRFHPRCVNAAERCRREDPPLESLDGIHRVACFHPVTSSQWTVSSGPRDPGRPPALDPGAPPAAGPPAYREEVR